MDKITEIIKNTNDDNQEKLIGLRHGVVDILF